MGANRSPSRVTPAPIALSFFTSTSFYTSSRSTFLAAAPAKGARGERRRLRLRDGVRKSVPRRGNPAARSAEREGEDGGTAKRKWRQRGRRRRSIDGTNGNLFRQCPGSGEQSGQSLAARNREAREELHRTFKVLSFLSETGRCGSAIPELNPDGTQEPVAEFDSLAARSPWRCQTLSRRFLDTTCARADKKLKLNRDETHIHSVGPHSLLWINGTRPLLPPTP